MDIENQENQQEQTDVQNSLMAGFNKVRGDEPPAEDPPTETSAQTDAAQPAATTETTENTATAAEADTTATTKETADKATDAAPAAEDDPIVPGLGLKASEVKNLLSRVATFDQAAIEEKVSQRMFGKFGEVQRAINELKKAPTGQPMKVTSEKLKRLNEEYPDLAKVIAEDLSDVLMAPAGTFAKEEVDQIVADKLAEKSAEFELKLLTTAHPDWYENRHSAEFPIWLSTLPPEVRHQVENSQDSTFLTKAFTGFKAWKSAAQQAQQAAAEAAAAKQKNEKRLEGGISPTGVTPPAPPQPTAASAMLAGFKKVRPGR